VIPMSQLARITPGDNLQPNDREFRNNSLGAIKSCDQAAFIWDAECLNRVTLGAASSLEVEELRRGYYCSKAKGAPSRH